MTNPPPRPVLRKAPDAAISPAIALVSPPLHEVVPPSQSAGRAKGKKSKGITLAPAPVPPKAVTFEVTIPKRLRKQLDQRSVELGRSRDEVLTTLLEAWLEG